MPEKKRARATIAAICNKAPGKGFREGSSGRSSFEEDCQKGFPKKGKLPGLSKKPFRNNYDLSNRSINSNSVILMDAFDHELIFRNQNEKIPKEL